MFDKLNQIKKLKELESALSQTEAIVEKDGVKVVINGKMEIKEVKLSSNIEIEKQGETVKNCLNEAMRKVQMEAAKKMF
jgi:DNA-binding protein YbaB